MLIFADGVVDGRVPEILLEFNDAAIVVSSCLLSRCNFVDILFRELSNNSVVTPLEELQVRLIMQFGATVLVIQVSGYVIRRECSKQDFWFRLDDFSDRTIRLISLNVL